MVDVKKELVTELSKILPTYYELIADRTASKPCITYIESMNAADLEAESFGYSRLRYTVKVWGYTIDNLAGYCQQVDAAMRQLGYRRSGSYELAINDEIEIVMDYDALCVETFTESED